MKGIIKVGVMVATAAMAISNSNAAAPSLSFNDLSEPVIGTASGGYLNGPLFVDASSGNSEILNFGVPLFQPTGSAGEWLTGDNKTLTEGMAQIYFSEGPLVVGAQISDVLEIHFSESGGVGKVWGVFKSDKSSPPDPMNYGFITAAEIAAGAAFAETGAFQDVTAAVNANLEPVSPTGGTGRVGIPAGFGTIMVASDVETVTVPDGGSTLAMLGLACLGFGAIRRKMGTV